MGSEIKKVFPFTLFYLTFRNIEKQKKNIQVAIALKTVRSCFNNFELLINENFTNKLKIHSDVLL